MENKIPEGSRISKGKGRLPAIWQSKKADWEPKLEKLQKLAQEKLNCSLAQLSIAWVIRNNDISTAILGAMNPEQITENLKALDVSKKMTKEILEEIETIMKNAPNGEFDYFNKFTEMPIRRNIQEGINKTEF
jgi:aryl-alcohol dehydrogenase-like predicted oxidoreductase